MATDEPQPEPPRTRRDEYAEQTRSAVVDAARTLFATQGYFATTVNDIAKAGRVSAGTVYQQCGGKHGLLRTLMEIWTTRPLVDETRERIENAGTGDEVLRILADAYLGMYRECGDIIQIIITTAPHDTYAAACLAEADARHRASLLGHARKLRQLGILTPRLSDDDFADIALFHFGGHNGIQFAVNALGWPQERARDWIRDQFTRCILDAAAGASS